MRSSIPPTASGRRLLFTTSLILALAVTSSAYTVVMRSGKRVEIPAEFTVTRTTLTYEAAPGFLITLQMASIDVPKTERANYEAPGSLLGRVAKQESQPQTTGTADVPRARTASRTITNRQLEHFARSRQESDRAYAQKRKEMGLPPLEVSRAQAAAETDRFWQELQKKRAQAEADARNAELQAQIEALNVQLNELRVRMSQTPSFSTIPLPVYGGWPIFDRFGSLGDPLFLRRFGLPAFSNFNAPFGVRRDFHGRRPGVFVAPAVPVWGQSPGR